MAVLARYAFMARTGIAAAIVITTIAPSGPVELGDTSSIHQSPDMRPTSALAADVESTGQQPPSSDRDVAPEVIELPPDRVDEVDDIVRAGNIATVVGDTADDVHSSSAAPVELTPGGDPATLDINEADAVAEFTIEKDHVDQEVYVVGSDSTFGGDRNDCRLVLYEPGVVTSTRECQLPVYGNTIERWWGDSSTVRGRIEHREGATGSLSLQAYEVPPHGIGGIDPDGTEVEFPVEEPGHRPMRVLFDGEEGQELNMMLGGSVVTASWCQVRVHEGLPEGYPFGTDNMIHSFHCSDADYIEELDPLPSTGSYTFEIWPFGYYDYDVPHRATVRIYERSDDLPLPQSCLDSPVRPMVLVHGLRRNPSDWNTHRPFLIDRVEDELQENGVPASEAEICAPSFVKAVRVDGLGSTARNGEVIRDEIISLVSSTNKENVGIDVVAHSKGGLDVRAAIERRGGSTGSGELDFVRNFVMLGTPNRGTPLADLACDLAATPGTGPIAGEIRRRTRQVLDRWFGPCDWTTDAVYQLTEHYVRGSFNPWYERHATTTRTIAGASSCNICRLLGPFIGPNDILVPVSSALYSTHGLYWEWDTFDRNHEQLLTDSDISEQIYCALGRWDEAWPCGDLEAAFSEDSVVDDMSHHGETSEGGILDAAVHLDSFDIPSNGQATVTVPALDGRAVDVVLLADQDGMTATASGVEFVTEDVALTGQVDSSEDVEVVVSNPGSDPSSVLLLVLSAEDDDYRFNVGATNEVTPPGNETIITAMDALRDGTELAGALDGEVRTPSGGSAPLEFVPFGPIAVAPYTPSEPGDHRVLVSHDDGVRRQVNAEVVTASTGAASFPGTFTESLREGPDNSLASGLDVAVDVEVDVEGNFGISGSLASANGEILASETKSGEIDVGQGSLELTFSGAELHAAGIDGPYEVVDLTLFHEVAGESANGLSREDRVRSLGVTGGHEAGVFAPAVVEPQFVTQPDAPDGDTVVVDVPVELSEPVGVPVTVEYQSVTPEGYAQSPDDFEAVAGTLTFQPGETSKSVPVTVHGGRLDNGDESLTVLLGFDNATNAVVGGFFGLGGTNIIPPPVVEPQFVTQPDAPDGDTVVVDVPVELSEPVGVPVTVEYQSVTPEGYAQSPDDFEAVAGTLTFQPGETSKSVPVTVHGGRLDNGDESLTVLLGFDNATNAVVGGFFGLGGINIVFPD